MSSRGVSSDDVVSRRFQSITERYKGAIDYKLQDGTTQKIAQWHNPKIFLDDLYGENQTKQFTSIMIIGSPGTGKSSLHSFISHGMHKRNPKYHVMHLYRKHLLKLDQTLNNVPPGRDLILNFHDVTGVFKDITNPAQKSMIVTTLTEARHPNFIKTQRKVMVIVNVHYENSMEKIWRAQGSWKIYTDMNSDESQVFNSKTHNKFETKVDIFQKTVLSQFRKKEFTVSLTNQKNQTYVTGGVQQDDQNSPLCGQWGKFRFIMVYDTVTVKFYLIPLEYCGLCSEGGQELKKTQATPKEIDQLICNYYGEKDGRAGMKLALTTAGITHQFRNKPVYAYNIAVDLLSTFEIDKEEFGNYYRDLAQIKDKRLYTSKRKKVDFFKDLEEIRAKHKTPLGMLTENKMRIQDEIDLNL